MREPDMFTPSGRRYTAIPAVLNTSDHPLPLAEAATARFMRELDPSSSLFLIFKTAKMNEDRDMPYSLHLNYHCVLLCLLFPVLAKAGLVTQKVGGIRGAGTFLRLEGAWVAQWLASPP
ncbi:hypothetical protein PoB_001206500 [Plakobranchus ocellatus]|uniref:Uncharacterized protein n=1 Tax=Plakobranchus ocellatus TaxID=259542 RepID=A0AAV3YS32_9GAST|nr:hypothetical protein PoB_001206500 [Plakobranchus ocellatus]